MIKDEDLSVRVKATFDMDTGTTSEIRYNHTAEYKGRGIACNCVRAKYSRVRSTLIGPEGCEILHYKPKSNNFDFKGLVSNIYCKLCLGKGILAIPLCEVEG